VPVSEHWNWRPFHEARISDVFSFRRRKHLKSIGMNYRKAQCFDRYFHEFREIYSQGERELAEFNIKLIMWFIEKFRIKVEVLRSTELDFNNGLTKNEMIIDLMKRVDGTHFISGDGAREYIEPGRFEQEGIALEFQNFRPEPYPQTYPGFIPNLSALDTLMNCGGLGPNGSPAQKKVAVEVKA